MPHASHSASAMADAMRPAPRQQEGWLDVDDGHRLWYGVSGAADGIPVLLVHGGPGSASTARQRGFHDPARYLIVQFDQRGCGRSTPLGATAHNHTDALLSDMEALRRHLGIARWQVAAGSWGATLALLYAARHRAAVSGLLLRGLFLATPADLEWFFHGVASAAPETHARFMRELPAEAQLRPWLWLDQCFAGGDEPLQRRIAAAWQDYEFRLNDPQAAGPGPANPLAHDPQRIARYRVQAHYLARHCFVQEGALLQAAAELADLPVALVHGTTDLVCRPGNSLLIHQACAGSRLAWAEGAPHHPWHPHTARLLRAASDAFAAHGDFSTWPPQGATRP